MSWRAYFAAFAVHSPVHVGYNTVSHVQRTRYFVPGRNMMSAFAAALGEKGGGISTSTLEIVRESFVFSTFFVSRNGISALFPLITGDGDLFYGNERLSLWDFTSQFISSKEGQKYKVGNIRSDMEFIVPKNNVKRTQNYLVGYLFVSDEAEAKGLVNWLRAIQELNIGEETNDKMGNVRLIVLEKLLQKECRAPFFSADGVYLDWAGEKVKVVYGKPGPLLGYLRVDNDSPYVGIYGVQEATEGGIDLLRNVPMGAAGKKCWVPGTRINPGETGATFVMEYDGMLTAEIKGEEQG